MKPLSYNHAPLDDVWDAIVVGSGSSAKTGGWLEQSTPNRHDA
jgi:hypothetical protein